MAERRRRKLSTARNPPEAKQETNAVTDWTALEAQIDQMHRMFSPYAKVVGVRMDYSESKPATPLLLQKSFFDATFRQDLVQRTYSALMVFKKHFQNCSDVVREDKRDFKYALEVVCYAREVFWAARRGDSIGMAQCLTYISRVEEMRRFHQAWPDVEQARRRREIARNARPRALSDEQIQIAIDKVNSLIQNGVGTTKAFKQVANEFGVCDRTIRRRYDDK